MIALQLKLRVIASLVVLCCFVFFGTESAHAAGTCATVLGGSGIGVTDGNTVLMLATTLFPLPPSVDLCTSLEAAQAMASPLNLNVEIDDAAAWGAKTQAQFATYRAIVLGDPNCFGPGTGPITAAQNNDGTWGPAITGPIAVVGTDPEFHFLNNGDPQKTTAAQLTQNAIALATSLSGQPGAYISLSCYYFTSAPNTPVPVLAPFGSFTVQGQGTGGTNNSHIVAPTNALVSTPNPLTDAGLSNWVESTHEAFNSIPSSFTEVVHSVDLNLPYILTGTLVTVSSGTSTGGTMQPGSNTNLSQDFVFNPTAGKKVVFGFDYNHAFIAGTLIVVNNTIPTASDDGVSQSDYQTMVNGTALAETSCMIGNGQVDANGNPACARLTLTCTNASSNTPSGANCPQSPTARNLYFKQLIDTTQPTIPLGSAPTLAAGSDNWSVANGCNFSGSESEGQLCPKSIATQFTDCCGIGGTRNSAHIFGCCEIEWTTTPTIALWNNSTTVPVSFTSVPPTIPNPNPHNWVAAPGKSHTFGFEAPGAAPDPTFPITSPRADQTLLNPNPPSGNVSAPCGSSATPLNWGTPGTNPPGFTTSGSVVVPGEGAYELHFFSTDCDDMEELVYAPNGANNWAKFKTTPFNVDLTKPTITITTPPPPPNSATYLLNQIVKASYGCTDALSGVASLTGTVPSGSNIPTGSVGPQTFTVTCTDVAGNVATMSVTYTVVDQPDDLDLFYFAPSNIKPGSNLTYFIALVNLTQKNVASGVVVTDTVPLGTTVVTAVFDKVTCSFWGCSIPKTGTPCTVSGRVVTCNIGSLAPLNTGTGVGILIVVKVPLTMPLGTVLIDTATATSLNRDIDNDNSVIIKTTVRNQRE